MFPRKMVDFKRKKPKNYKDWKWTIYTTLSLYEHLCSAFSASVYVCTWNLLKVTKKIFTFYTLILFRQAVKQTSPYKFTNNFNFTSTRYNFFFRCQVATTLHPYFWKAVCTYLPSCSLMFFFESETIKKI